MARSTTSPPAGRAAWWLRRADRVRFISLVIPRNALPFVPLGVLLFAGVAQANEGKPVPRMPTARSGGAEINGIADVAVVSERLELDFRPLESWDAPTVTATYELHNEGPAVHVPLVFASYRVGPGTVELDGATIATTSLSADELPQQWSTPNGPVAAETAGQADASGFSFEVDLAPGDHTMSVHYDLTGDFREFNPVGHSVRYSFQPAVSWKSVGTVEVVVHCPEDWTCGPRVDEDQRPSSNDLELVEDASTLRATHEGLPNTLRLVLRRPAPLWIAAAYPAALLGALLLVIGVVVGGGRFVARGRSGSAAVARWMLLVPVVLAGSCAYSTGVYEASELNSTAPVRGYASLEMGALGLLVALLALIALAVYAGMQRRRAEP